MIITSVIVPVLFLLASQDPLIISPLIAIFIVPVLLLLASKIIASVVKYKFVLVAREINIENGGSITSDSHSSILEVGCLCIISELIPVIRVRKLVIQ